MTEIGKVHYTNYDIGWELTCGEDKDKILFGRYKVSSTENLKYVTCPIVESEKDGSIQELYQGQGSDFRLNTMKSFNHFNKSQMGGLDILKSRQNTEINRMSDEMIKDEEEESNKDVSLYPNTTYTEVEFKIDLDEEGGVDDFEIHGEVFGEESVDDNVFGDVPSEGTDGLNINDKTPKIQKFSTGEYGFGNLSDIQSNTSSPIVKFNNFK